ncbi:MAG: biotin transporter BioY [Agathobacter sp.]|nr:biotin transporter BioY [Agathobacter sp.]
MNTKLKTQTLTKIALCVAILCVTSFLIVPLPFTPIVISLHTIVVNMIGLTLKPKEAGLTILIYLLMGLIGLPVFSAGTGGPGKLFGPTGGFYFGFLFAVIAISVLRGKKISMKRYCFVSILVGMPIQHLCAIIVMCMHNGGNLEAAFATVSLPFILGDIFKCVMASIVGVALNKVIK